MKIKASDATVWISKYGTFVPGKNMPEAMMWSVAEYNALPPGPYRERVREMIENQAFKNWRGC